MHAQSPTAPLINRGQLDENGNRLGSVPAAAAGRMHFSDNVRLGTVDRRVGSINSCKWRAHCHCHCHCHAMRY